MLTILGIFVGVASVIWLLAISEGISREVQRQIEELGAQRHLAESNAGRRLCRRYGNLLC